jgi:hypothetical protein
MLSVSPFGDRHFDTIQVPEAESQAVLNTLTRYDLLDSFQENAEALGTAHGRRMGIL